MTTVCLAAVLQISLAASDVGETYAQARRTTTETGRPLVIMVSADWCAACREMKETVIPEVKQGGSFEKVSFAVVDLDREQKLGQQLIRGGLIPQLLMYRRTPAGWRLRRLIGGQSKKTVENFIAEGIALDEATKAGAGSRSATTVSQQGQIFAVPLDGGK